MSAGPQKPNKINEIFDSYLGVCLGLIPFDWQDSCENMEVAVVNDIGPKLQFACHQAGDENTYYTMVDLESGYIFRGIGHCKSIYWWEVPADTAQAMSLTKLAVISDEEAVGMSCEKHSWVVGQLTPMQIVISFLLYINQVDLAYIMSIMNNDSLCIVNDLGQPIKKSEEASLSRTI